MIAEFFNASFQNYEDQIQLKQINQDSPNPKYSPLSELNAKSQSKRTQKLQSYPKQILQLIHTIVPNKYLEEILSLEGAEYLHVKNTHNHFFGESSMVEIHNPFSKTNAKVAEGICELFYQNNSYLIGIFQHGRLQNQFVYILGNGNYIKAKPKFNKSKRSVTGFITDDSQSLASDDDDTSDDGKIDQSQIHLQIDNQKQTEFLSNLQCQINFNRIYYSGTVKKGQLDGNIFQKGNDYEFSGIYLMGDKKKGKLISNLGFQYQGTFKNNKFHGLGTMKTFDGVYSGEFKNGLKDGQGEFKWSDGSFYKGDYRKDQRHGKGFFKSNQGSFKGQWRNDEIDGPGYLVIGNQGIGGQWRRNSYEQPNKFF